MNLIIKIMTHEIKFIKANNCFGYKYINRERDYLDEQLSILLCEEIAKTLCYKKNNFEFFHDLKKMNFFQINYIFICIIL